MRFGVAVIGGGLSGLTAARVLGAAKIPTVVLEKSAHGTGRILSRRIDDAKTVSVDLGAQYFTARDPVFREQVSKWIDNGVVAKWNARFGSFDAEGNFHQIKDKPENERFVGVPGNSSICKSLVEELSTDSSVELRSDALVKELRFLPDSKEWHIEVSSSEEKSAVITSSYVLVTVPSGQLIPLFESSSLSNDLKDKAASVSMEKCWALGLVLKTNSNVPLDADGLFVNNSKVISWISRESSKPGRSMTKESWSIHAQPEWSNDTFEKPKEEVFKEMLEEFCKILKLDPVQIEEQVEDKYLMRWKFAKASKPLTEPQGILVDSSSQLVIGGDWVNGSRVEGAFMSGFNAGTELSKSYSSKTDAKL
jgi:renalase